MFGSAPIRPCSCNPSNAQMRVWRSQFIEWIIQQIKHSHIFAFKRTDNWVAVQRAHTHKTVDCALWSPVRSASSWIPNEFNRNMLIEHTSNAIQSTERDLILMLMDGFFSLAIARGSGCCSLQGPDAFIVQRRLLIRIMLCESGYVSIQQIKFTRWFFSQLTHNCAFFCFSVNCPVNYTGSIHTFSSGDP